jgi:fatty-acyl-CoA synthase
VANPVDEVARILRAPAELFASLLRDPIGTTTRLAGRTAVEAHAVATLLRAGVVGPEPPWRLAEIGRVLLERGPMAAAPSLLAIRHGERAALVDDLGSLTYAQIDQRAEALAGAWQARGLRAGDGVGILCRNGRGLLGAVFACTKLGARALLLNTDFAAPQAIEVCAREGADAVVADADLFDIVAGVDAPRGRYVAWVDPSVPGSGPEGDGRIDDLIAGGEPLTTLRPDHDFSIVILTSGTTGTPKGANRASVRSLSGPGALLSKIPFRAGDVVYVAPPMFHAWGLANAAMALALGGTVVTRRRFDPVQVWADLAANHCTGLVAVPVMLNRLLGNDDAAGNPVLPDLRVVAVSGSQLEAPLATRALDRFGPVLHNLYGSTEVAYATIATPDDLRAAPGSAGRPPFGVTVKVLGDDDVELPVGQIGRIFVANEDQFSGYTGGGGKAMVDGLMATGDVGHFDSGGRLWIDGRDDEMIVSGGENVFPHEVEALLAGHPAVVEAAVVGVPDDEFGQRLQAYLVRTPGKKLTAATVKAYVRENLARYKVPREVIFVDVLPRNPAGKVLKRVLVDQGG